MIRMRLILGISSGFYGGKEQDRREERKVKCVVSLGERDGKVSWVKESYVVRKIGLDGGMKCLVTDNG